MDTNPAHNPATPLLVEGVDYTVEAGQWVFTAAYHLKRGHCCGSGCRNCPYGIEEQEHTGRQNSTLHER